MDKKRLIIINRMYAGKYLTEGENIGHEIINLIRSDNGNNYLWLNADGNCDISKFIDKKGNLIYDEIIMLMVSMYGHRKWKVLAKAEIDTSDLHKYMAPEFNAKYHKIQSEIINKEGIFYGGKPLDEIFSGNYFNGQLQSGIDIYFTFKAQNLLLPCETPENIEKTIIDITGTKGLANQSLRMYLHKDKDLETFNKFNDIINGEIFEWENENTTQKVDEDYKSQFEEKDYFLKIINEEYRELTFSNLLAYFLKNKKIMLKFAKEVLSLNNFDENSYSIAREEKNIDLFISSPEHYIIIENKIRSGLIKESKSMEKKIREYYGEENNKIVTQEAKDLIDVFDAADHYYQTDRYYAYACGVIARQKSYAAISGYVLFPNYSLHTISKEIEDTLFKNFKPLTYKRIYEFFDSIKNDNDLLNCQEKMYLNEFLLAMEKHKKDVDNSFEEEMKERFYKKIKN